MLLTSILGREYSHGFISFNIVLKPIHSSCGEECKYRYPFKTVRLSCCLFNSSFLHAVF
jgi:hypothetical protein